ncbi:glycosyl hydrolase [Streptomyces sp. BE20]|uniref:glycoside hydrolase family 26 protein n=1 Tax=Streptomyces sp. BE20 TaxID=3002525 RepID=UPI002E78C123|nr:glycosyl hydrolase [Streptomyces sp. BE20]MEE1826938.1 glycosyl hydrolase [Streptomyces sp. BE20]
MALPRPLHGKPAALAVSAAVLATGALVLGGRDDRSAPPPPGPAGPTGRSELTLNGAGRALPPEVGRDLLARDPQASPNARAVQQLLADLEATARSGRSGGTVIGQHIEGHNERYNPEYGDYRGTKPVGYYYKKAADITGKLPGFVETDLGPGYGQSGWGVGNPRSYSEGRWPACAVGWQYTDDAVDLMAAVWSGHPRAADGTYGAAGVQKNCDGTATELPDNGGAPAGLVGMSFHQPYPGSDVKSFDRVLCSSSPAAGDPGWFGRVVDSTGGTPEYRALLTDLSFLADHLEYLAAHDVPVLLRPYHEMNAADCARGFWWSGQKPADYQALWRITYHYLVETRGLHNLLFAWTPVSWDGAPGVDPWNYYPGAQYVDLVGVDDYSGSPARPIGTGEAWTKRYYDGLAGYGKPRILAESFAVPVNSRQPDTLRRTPWTIWTVWGQSLTADNLTPEQPRNSNADVKATYDDALALTGGSAAFGANVDWSGLHVR